MATHVDKNRPKQEQRIKDCAAWAKKMHDLKNPFDFLRVKGWFI